MIFKFNEQVQQASEQTTGKILIGLGSGGTAIDYITDWNAWIDIFLKFGNVMLLLGGLYLMANNVIYRYRKNRAKHRRSNDS